MFLVSFGDGGSNVIFFFGVGRRFFFWWGDPIGWLTRMGADPNEGKLRYA